MSKRLGGIIGCKDKTSSWHLTFPYGGNIGSTAHRYTVVDLCISYEQPFLYVLSICICLIVFPIYLLFCVLLLLFVVFLTLTNPLRIQPWSQDRRNQTKSNRESEISMESRQKRTDKKVASKGHRRDKIGNMNKSTIYIYIN